MHSLIATIALTAALAQPADPRRLHPIIKEQADAFAKVWLQHQSEGLAQRAHAKVTEVYGGRPKLLAALHESIERMHHQGLRVQSHEVGFPPQLAQAGRDWFAVLPFTVKLEITEGRGELKSWLLAVSSDDGATWSVHDGYHCDPTKLRAAWPKFPAELKLPARPQVEITERDTKRKVHTSKTGNYKLVHAPSWNIDRSTDRDFILQHGGEAIFIYADESPLPLEEQLADADQQQRFDTQVAKTIFKKEIKVAGEPASQWLVEFKRNQGYRHTTLFVHQGMVYRVIGLQREENSPDFEREYYSILERFAFLRDREEWLRKSVGIPKPTALAGGLAFFETARPRWTEITFEDPPAATDILDQAAYQHVNQSAWLYVRLREAQGNAAVELDELETTLAQQLIAPQTKRLTTTVAGQPTPMLEISGVYNNRKYLRRGIVVIRDGIALQLYLDCYMTQKPATQPEWESLLASVRLQSRSKPETPLAFSPRHNFADHRNPDPHLTALLAKARPVYPWPRSQDLRGVSANGEWAFLQPPEGDFIENLATRKKTALGRLPYLGNFGGAVSNDGQYVAITDGRQIAVQSRLINVPLEIPGSALGMTFGVQSTDLYLCHQDVSVREPALDGGLAPVRFNLSRLERLDLQTGKRQTLIEFPLGRVQFPAFSPDGKRLAVVTNRDYARTQISGGHVYLAKADGSGLQQLTKEPAVYSSLVWSEDGRWLYAVQHPDLQKRNQFAVGGGYAADGGYDLVRIDSQNGAVVNLTRTGSIGRVWHAGKSILFDLQNYRLPTSQMGCYRIAVEELDRWAKTAPAKPLAKSKDGTEAIAEAVRRAVGSTLVRDVVPNAALMAKIADAFAVAAREHVDPGFDFSRQSLNALDGLLNAEASQRQDSVFHLGLAAYYGETLRRTADAEWMIKPQPLGEWSPGRLFPDNMLVRLVLPFTETLNSHSTLLPDSLARMQGQKLILVYPPSYAAEAVKKATGPAYYQARDLLDAGKIDEALAVFAKELGRQPNNVGLAREAIAVCEACRMPELAAKLTKQAIAAGTQVPDLLLRHADQITKSDPKRALALYRQAAQAPFPSALLLLKLADAYVALGQPALAESCWRRAYQSATDAERRTIRRNLGMSDLSALNRFDNKQRRFGNDFDN